MPQVSVIMPSYNHARFIGEAMDSVLSQDYRDLELIVVDDASADDSRGVIESYRARDPRIRAFFHDVNQGISRTVNQGLDEARGEYVAFLSSDDVWVEHKLRGQLDVLEKNPDLVVYSEVLLIDGDGRTRAEEPGRKRWSSGVIRRESAFPDLLNGNHVPGQSLIMRRRNLEGIRYDERFKYVNDWKFVLDLASRYDFYLMPEPLVKYRVHGGNTISRDAVGWLSDFAALGQYLLSNYGDRLPGRTKAKLLYRIGCGAHFRGDRARGRAWMAKAIVANPFKSEYYLGFLRSFARRAVVPRSVRRRVR